MALDNVSDEQVASAINDIEAFLSRSIPIRDITAVEAEEVKARTSGFDTTTVGDYEILLRLKTTPIHRIDVIESRRELDAHLRDQLESMEQNSGAPDTLIVASDHPPNKRDPLVFYLRSVL